MSNLTPDFTQSIKRRPAPRGTAAYPRKRAVTACQVCRARRTKCDNKKPSCSFCEKTGAECIVSSADLSSFDPASLKILERLDQLEDILLSPQPSQISTVGTDDVLPSGASPEYHTLRITVMDVLSWPVFQGQFDSRSDLKSLLRSSPIGRHQYSPASTESYVFMNDLDPSMGLRLLDSFLRHVHVKNPILEEAKIRRMVHHVSLDGFGWDSESCLVLLIYALGSIASSFDDISSSNSTNLARAETYFSASQKRIGTLLGRGGILEAQCFFFSGVYLMSVLQPIHAWRLFIQALACCQEFHFATRSFSISSNANPDALGGPPEEESVYWTCWKSELELRMHLELPDFQFKDHVYPHLFPTPSVEVAEGSNRAWYFYLAEISLRRFETRIRDEICHTPRPRSETSFVELADAALSYEEQAIAWVRSLPEIMSLETPEIDDDVLKFILRGHLMNLYEVVYWPFVEAVINEQQDSEVVRSFARKGLRSCLDRIHKNQPGFTHRHHGTWFMIQACTRSALVLLAAAYVANVAELMPEGWRDAVLGTIDLLRYWENEVGDARDRLQILERVLESVELGISLVGV